MTRITFMLNYEWLLIISKQMSIKPLKKMFELEFLTQFEASNAKYKSVDRKSRWAAAGIDWTLLVIEMCGDCLVGDPGLSDDAITGPHHQIQSVEKIAILYWPLRPGQW